jgi:hypothetical protein
MAIAQKKDLSLDNEFHDFFEISSGEMTSVVPLHAFSNSAIILFDNFIDLGFVSLGKEMSQLTKDKPDVSYFNLENQGLIDGKIIIQNNDKELSIEPNEFVIKPGKSETVKCNYFFLLIISTLPLHQERDLQVYHQSLCEWKPFP